MKLFLLLILALPVYAQAPGTPPILISGEEREAIIAKFAEMAAVIERHEKLLRICHSVGRI